MGKRLGQHFLTNAAIVKRIVDAAGIEPDDTVLEVGPGRGILTEELVARAKKVIAVEKDHNLVLYLREKYKDKKNMEIVEGDILKHGAWSMEHETGFKIVANLPYYITSRFLRVFLETEELRPASMTLMIQKEVAERICAAPPDMNLFALSVQAFGVPKILFRVAAGSFSPPPEVDSAVIKIDNISDMFFKKNGIQPQEFFKLPKKAFSQKRKMLRASIPEAKLPEFATKRPQELSLDDWVCIIKNVQS
mgnify:CR=1 FL=1